MANEIVKYDNYLNNLSLSGFTPSELDLLMAICSKMKERNTDEICFDFKEIRDLSNYWETSNMRLINALDSMNTKLSRITCKIETERYVIKFILFTTFVIDKKALTLTIGVNPKFSFVLNALSKNFTRFELEEFVKLDRKYSKHLYMLLKQFRSTGKLFITLDDFRRKMDIPQTYENRDVMEKIIKPTVREIEPYFKGIFVSVQKAHRRGAPVTGYTFTFQKENSAIIPVQDNEKNIAKKKSQIVLKNKKIHNFKERDYSDQQIELMEKILGGYATEEEKCEYDKIMGL